MSQLQYFLVESPCIKQLVRHKDTETERLLITSLVSSTEITNDPSLVPLTIGVCVLVTRHKNRVQRVY